jgi:hypothetical protein
VRPDGVPEDVRLIALKGLAVAEDGSAVRGPGHLIHARSALDPLNAQTLTKALASLQIFDELG